MFNCGQHEGEFDAPAPLTRMWQVQRRADGVTLLVDGSLVAYWYEANGSAPEAGALRATGELVAALHGPRPDDLPTVDGIVRRLWVTSQLFVPRPDKGPQWMGPVGGTLALREVEHSPRRFDMRSIFTPHGARDDMGLLVCANLG